MASNRNTDRSVVVYRSSDLFTIEAIAQELRASGIACSIEGRATAAAFAGFTALDGVTEMKILVLESDASAARQIADQWPNRDSPPGEDAGD